MKYTIALTLGLLAAGSALADTNAVATANAALDKLNAAANYAWTTTVKIPNMPFTPGPVSGVTEKDGYSLVSQDFNGNTMQAAFKGDKIAVKGQDDWQAAGGADDQTSMMAGYLVNHGNPGSEAASLIKDAADLSAGDGGVISGDLTAAGAKEMIAPPARGGNTQPPPQDAKGSVKFWITDGTLTKFESHLQAQMSFGDQVPQAFEVTRTVEIHDIGTTNVVLPDEAKKALGITAAAK